MTLRTKGEQKAYLDGYEMCGECIEKYLSAEGKRQLECLLSSVRAAVDIEDLPTEPGNTGEWIKDEDDEIYLRCSKCNCWVDRRLIQEDGIRFCPWCGDDKRGDKNNAKMQ